MINVSDKCYRYPNNIKTIDLKVKQYTRKVGCIQILKKVLYIKFLYVHLQRKKRRMYVALVVRMAVRKSIWQALALLHIRCYTFHCSFRSLNNTTPKYGQTLVQLMTYFQLVFSFIERTRKLFQTLL